MASSNQQILSKEQAFQKLKQYCAYQERCHQEVKDKLYSFGLHRKEVDELISQLIEENYLNEERFAIQFAGGKFRMKQWGKVKIKYALKQRFVSDYCIRRALAAINAEDYWATLQKVAHHKFSQLRNDHVFVKRKKLQAYLMQKGFESDLIREAMQEMEA